MLLRYFFVALLFYKSNVGICEHITSRSMKNTVKRIYANEISLDEYVYVIGGDIINGQYIAILDSSTLETLQAIPLPPSLYLGTLQLSETGDIFCVHANRLYIFKQGDIMNYSSKLLLNISSSSDFVHYDSFSTLRSNYIVLKRKNIIIYDLIMILLEEFKIDYNVFLVSGISIIFLFNTLLPFSLNNMKKKKQKGQSYIKYIVKLVITIFVMIITIVFITVMLSMLFLFIYFNKVNMTTFLIDSLLFRHYSDIQILSPFNLSSINQFTINNSNLCNSNIYVFDNYFNNTKNNEKKDLIVIFSVSKLIEFSWEPFSNSLQLLHLSDLNNNNYNTVMKNNPILYNNSLYFFTKSYKSIFSSNKILSVYAHTINNNNNNNNKIEKVRDIDNYDHTSISYIFQRNNNDIFYLIYNSKNNSLQCFHHSNMSIIWQLQNLNNIDGLHFDIYNSNIYITTLTNYPNYFMKFFNNILNNKYYDKYLLVINVSNGIIVKKELLSNNETSPSSIIAKGYDGKLYIGLSDGLLLTNVN